MSAQLLTIPILAAPRPAVSPAEIEDDPEGFAAGQRHLVGDQAPVGDRQAHMPPLVVGLAVDAGYDSHRLGVQMQGRPGGVPVVGECWKREL